MPGPGTGPRPGGSETLTETDSAQYQDIVDLRKSHMTTVILVDATEIEYSLFNVE